MNKKREGGMDNDEGAKCMGWGIVYAGVERAREKK